MGLYSGHNNFYGKRGTEIGFAVTWSSAHTVFLKSHAPIFLRILHAQKMLNEIDDDDNCHDE
jgi:hypothetical protein